MHCGEAEADRRLTPLECERLQGFPDYWTDIPGASDSARYKALGNSVAIPCVDFILRGIAYFLRQMKEDKFPNISGSATVLRQSLLGIALAISSLCGYTLLVKMRKGDRNGRA